MFWFSLAIKLNLNVAKVTVPHSQLEGFQFKVQCGLGQALQPNLSTRQSVTSRLCIVKCSDEQLVNVAVPFTVA